MLQRFPKNDGGDMATRHKAKNTIKKIWGWFVRWISEKLRVLMYERMVRTLGEQGQFKERDIIQ